MTVVYRSRDILAELLEATLFDNCLWCTRSYPVTPHSQRPYCSHGCRSIAETNGGNNARHALTEYDDENSGEDLKP